MAEPAAARPDPPTSEEDDSHRYAAVRAQADLLHSVNRDPAACSDQVIAAARNSSCLRRSLCVVLNSWN
jgi:hypothetical protein